MKNIISRVFGLAWGIGASLLPLVSLAQITPTGPNAQLPPAVNANFQTVSGAFCTVVAWLFTLLIILTIIFILWAAWYYLSAGGEEEKIKKANHMLLYAGIAVLVAILSRAFPFIIGTLFGATSFTGGSFGCN